ncbi:MAG: glutathione S-transferase C-terminal domain-containing protein [Spirochaetaceae bacterium]|nr:glutathione S-transferase C-terminal domain-containing protein [Spirochaetaceae bacterium]
MPYRTVFPDEPPIPGAFKRRPNYFTTPFGFSPGELPVEKGRYRLIWSKACPWATRQMIVRSLLGLEDVISVGTVDPVRPPHFKDQRGERTDWAFSLDPGGVDPVLNIKRLSEIYLATDGEYEGRFTVPAVIEVKTRKVVNTDYFNMTYYWETVWKDFHKKDAPDLFPEDLREEIIALNEVIYYEVNNGVYKAGFAETQEAYADACEKVFIRLDELEKRLAKGRYLFGDRLTDSDIRLYVTLARFDAAYYNAFRVNLRRLRDYPALWAYARSLYRIPAFRENTDFDHIKIHYHLCCDRGNVLGLLPKGPDNSDWLPERSA